MLALRMTEMSDHSIPTRSKIIEMVAREIYSGRILNNSHRGDIVEMMVLSALGGDWKHVGLGWHPWDLQLAHGIDRERIQVRQTAALQLWGGTVSRSLQFNWKPNPPSYFKRDNPDEEIEPEGWFCDLFIFGIHDEADPDLADQVDPAQWAFMVIPTCDLQSGMKSMNLSQARARWPLVDWSGLREEVEKSLVRSTNKRLEAQAKTRDLRGKVHWEGNLEEMRLD